MTENTILNQNETILSQVCASELNSLLQNALKQSIKVLSLDCFDTLIWRKTTTPNDVFYHLQDQPLFKKLGFSAELRTKLEKQARKKVSLENRWNEVTLSDIYNEFSTTLTELDIKQLTKEELESEKAFCFAFQPMVDLIHQAHQAGLCIIIVSDIYFSENELRELLASTLPKKTYEQIHHVFTSADHRTPKSKNLFGIVQKTLNMSPKAFLHIGDHMQADVESANRNRMHAAHFIHHDTTIGEWLRLNNVSNLLTHPEARRKKPLLSHFKDFLAQRNYDKNDLNSIIAHSSLGPIYYCFYRLLQSKIQEIQQNTGKKPKIAFLMRDGHLISSITNTIDPTIDSNEIFISRFTTHAASFTHKNDIHEYLIKVIESNRYEEMCKQLLLDELTTTFILAKVKNSPDQINTFLSFILNEKTINQIINASTKFRKRLFTYLNNELNLADGDQIIFVDLGYTGTSQNKLSPLIKNELGCDIYGCYLISLDQPFWQQNRCGLLDPSVSDQQILHALVNYISIMEMISTSNSASVINYTDSGMPIFSERTLSDSQHDKIEKLQIAISRTVSDIHYYYQKNNNAPTISELQDFARAELMRFIFLPTVNEINLFKDIQFDINLGTKDILSVMNPEQAVHDLEKRGLFFMELNAKSMRTNYPADLRYADISYALMLFNQQLTGLDIRKNEISHIRQPVSIICLDQHKTFETIIDATPTYNGYFSIQIPIGQGELSIGIQFGTHFHWMQIESVEAIPVDKLFSPTESLYTEDVSHYLSMHEMKDHAHGLFECLSPNALILFKTDKTLNKNRLALRIVFRPIAKRESTKC